MLRPVLAVVWLVSALTIAQFVAQSALASDDIGVVERARGAVVVLRQDASQPLRSGSGVQVLDSLQTGEDARLQVVFADGSELSMGSSSQLTVDDMVYEPARRGRGVLRLSQGVFRLVSGQLNKVPDGALTIITPLATIGVRGTDFWGQQTPDKLVMALLDDGELTITTAQGAVTLTDPLSAIVVYKGQAPGALYTLTPQQLAAAKATVAW